jgi:hypothetical protein
LIVFGNYIVNHSIFLTKINTIFVNLSELIKGNPTNFETIIHLIVLNDLNTQQQYYSNQSNQVQQQQQIPQNRNQHYLNILQAVFSTDGVQASKVN